MVHAPISAVKEGVEGDHNRFVRGEALYTTLLDHPALIVVEDWLPYQIRINKNSVHFSQQSPK